MALTKPTVRPPWAGTAATSSITDPDSVTSGFVSGGWPLSSQPPSRQFFNWVLNYCMEGVRYLCQNGIAAWDPAETYNVGSIAVASNNIVYQSLTANNTNNAPASSPANWGGLNGYALTGSLGGFVTEAQLTAALASYVTSGALAADLSNYATLTELDANGSSAVYQAEAYTAQSLQNYYTASQVGTILTGYLTVSSFNAQIANYVTQSLLGTTSSNLEVYADNIGDNAVDQSNEYTNSQLASYAPLSDFTSGTGANGFWEKSPTGVIHQWGISVGAASAPGATIAFPVAFTELQSVTASFYGSTATVGVYSAGNSSFQLISGINGQCSWNAYGR